MKASIFTTLFIVLVLVVLFYTIQEQEPFQSSPDTLVVTPTLKVPEAPVAQRNLVEGSTEDYAPSWTLATGPAPGAIASFNSLPYQDPSLEKAKYKRILNVETTLKGFLDDEAPHIQELSDPSIQLPLATARSDLVRLQNEVLVLKRNPGIDSSVTQGDIDEIEANLQYLQKKWRLSIYNETEIEGFQDASGSDIGDNSSGDYSGGYSNDNSSGGYSNDNSSGGYSNTGSTSSSNMPSYSDYLTNNTSNTLSNITNYMSGKTGSNTNVQSDSATLQELVQLNQNIDITIARLGASGTTEPVVLARISSLQKIKQKVQNIINNVNSGVLAQQDIPISENALSNFLKVSSNTNSPLPKIFNSNVGLGNLFPAYSSGDVNGAKVAQYLFQKYSDMLFSNISFDLNVHYSSPAEQTLANSLINAIGNNLPNVNTSVNPIWSGNENLPSYAYDVNTSNNNFTQFNGSMNGNNQNIFQTLTNNQLNGTTSVASNMSVSNVGPTHFNWQERGNFICDSIQKQGMNPKDFGCLRPDEYVSENFSWRGYAKMICSRLSASMDTGLPETCGCPPATWPGWRP